MTDREARLALRIVALLWRPRPLTREEKKRAGLKYCRYAGYGFKWCRGRRVPDPDEQWVIAQIVERRRAGCSWYAIAAELLRQNARTVHGREWSVARCRRAYAVVLRRPTATAAAGGAEQKKRASPSLEARPGELCDQ